MHGVLKVKVKVKVKGHVIRALLCCHENRRRRGGLLYVLTVYPAESWAPRIRAHECFFSAFWLRYLTLFSLASATSATSL